jgi:hypothetical protein
MRNLHRNNFLAVKTYSPMGSLNRGDGERSGEATESKKMSDPFAGDNREEQIYPCTCPSRNELKD